MHERVSRVSTLYLEPTDSLWINVREQWRAQWQRRRARGAAAHDVACCGQVYIYIYTYVYTNISQCTLVLRIRATRWPLAVTIPTATNCSDSRSSLPGHHVTYFFKLCFVCMPPRFDCKLNSSNGKSLFINQLFSSSLKTFCGNWN